MDGGLPLGRVCAGAPTPGPGTPPHIPDRWAVCASWGWGPDDTALNYGAPGGGRLRSSGHSLEPCPQPSPPWGCGAVWQSGAEIARPGRDILGLRGPFFGPCRPLGGPRGWARCRSLDRCAAQAPRCLRAFPVLGRCAVHRNVCRLLPRCSFVAPDFGVQGTPTRPGAAVNSLVRPASCAFLPRGRLGTPPMAGWGVCSLQCMRACYVCLAAGPAPKAAAAAPTLRRCFGGAGRRPCAGFGRRVCLQ